jgi:hypothetical protein
MVAKYTLQETASASDGFNACRSLGWLHRMGTPPTVVSPGQATRVSGEITPALSAAMRVGSFMNEPGCTGVLRRCAWLLSIVASVARSICSQAVRDASGWGACARSVDAATSASATARAILTRRLQ